MTNDQTDNTSVGGRPFTPRAKKLRFNGSPVSLFDLREKTPAQQVTSQPSVTPVTVVCLSCSRPADQPTAPATEQPKAEAPAPSAPNWKRLPEKALWTYFVKLRELHKRFPNGENVRKRYLEVREFLFLRYRHDVRRIVDSYHYRNMPQYSLLEKTDLLQSAEMAMLRLLDEYNPEIGTTFMEFANARDRSRLRGAIIDCLRSLQDYPRIVARVRREIKPMMTKLRNKLRHRPTPEEFCDEYGWQYSAILTDHLFWSGVFNQGNMVVEEDTETLPLVQCEARPEDPARNVDKVDFQTLVLSKLTDPDVNYIIWSYHFMGSTNEKIAKSLNKIGKKCSLSWVISKHKEGLAILRQHFTREELEDLIR